MGAGFNTNFEPFSGRQPLNINYGNETRKRGKYIKQLHDTGIIKWILDSKNDIAEGPQNELINPAKKYFTLVIVRLDRPIQNLMKTLDSPIKSGNDEPKKFKCLLAGLIIIRRALR